MKRLITIFICLLLCFSLCSCSEDDNGLKYDREDLHKEYNRGYDDGYNDGYSDGKNDGVEEGFDDGWDDASDYYE